MKETMKLTAGLLLGLCLSAALFAGGDRQSGNTTAGSGPTTIEYWYSPAVDESPPPPTNWDVIQKIREKTNVNLVISALPSDGSDWDVKLNTAGAANALPDFFETRLEPWRRLVDYGLLASVDDLYALMPNRTKLHYDADSRAFTSINGKSYALGTPGSVPRLEGLVIRKDWLDKLGLKAPVTTDEFLNVMKAFTFNDPDGNGRNDTYGFGAFVQINTYEEGLGRRFEPFFGAFGVPGTWNLTKANAGLNIRKPAYYDALVYIKSIIDAGIIDPNWTSYKQDDFRAAWKQGRWGLMRENHSAVSSEPNYAPFDQLFPNGQWLVIDPPKGPTGQQAVGVYVVDYRLFSISKKAGDAGKGSDIARMLEWMSTDEGYYLLGWGVEGVNFVRDQDGVPTATGIPDPSKGFNRPDIVSITQLRRLVYYNSEIEMLARYPTYTTAFSKKPMSALVYLRDMQSRPWIPNIGAESMPTPNADLRRFYEQSIIEFVLGRRPLSRESWIAWVAEFDRMGGLDWEKNGLDFATKNGYLY
jgi:putative aldouronate transport system substrate-binding protein